MIVKECNLQLTLGMKGEEKTRLSVNDNCLGRGVGGWNLSQTQVELSGLNHVRNMSLAPWSGSG